MQYTYAVLQINNHQDLYQISTQITLLIILITIFKIEKFIYITGYKHYVNNKLNSLCHIHLGCL